MSESHSELKIAEGGAWSAPEMLRMGFSPDALARARRRFQVAYWRDRFGGYHYPKWQFDRSMKVIPEIAEVLGILRSDDTARVLGRFLVPVAPGRKSLLNLIRAGRGKRAIAIIREEEDREEGIPPPTKKQIAELDRRVKEYEDDTRYVIASCLRPDFCMFYDIEKGVYLLKEIAESCFFRRRDHAEAVARLLDGKKKKRSLNSHRVVAIKRTPKTVRFLESVSDPFDSRKKFKPRARFKRPSKPPILAPIAVPGGRGHIVEGFLFVSEHRKAVSELVANARSRAEARKKLISECRLSSTQADAVLELRLHHFNRAAHRKYESELRALLHAEQRHLRQPLRFSQC